MITCAGEKYLYGIRHVLLNLWWEKKTVNPGTSACPLFFCGVVLFSGINLSVKLCSCAKNMRDAVNVVNQRDWKCRL